MYTGGTHRLTLVWPGKEHLDRAGAIADGLVVAAGERDIPVEFLTEERARRCYLAEALLGASHTGHLLVFIAHGTQDGMGIWGQCDHRALVDKTNLEVLANRRVFAVVCHCGAKLGRMAPKGEHAYFIGFNTTTPLAPLRGGSPDPPRRNARSRPLGIGLRGGSGDPPRKVA